MIYITGGLGFIGTHVADAYLEGGAEITLIDSMVAAVVDGVDYEAHPRCRVIRQPVEDWLAEGGSFRGAECVIHAASHVGPARILRAAGHLGSEMVYVTSAVLRACLEADVPVCSFSSAEVYGRSGLLGEKDDIRVPTDYNVRIEYAIGKILTEAMVTNLAVHGLRGFVIRPFNVVGSRQSREGGFVMPILVQQALEGRPLTVFATGQQVRAFTAASDLARFLTDHFDEALGSDRKIYNIGNPANATTIWNLAERVVDLLDSPSEIHHVDGKMIHGPLYEEAESFEKLPLLDAARDAGWEPAVDLDALILETADWYREHEDLRGAYVSL